MKLSVVVLVASAFALVSAVPTTSDTTPNNLDKRTFFWLNKCFKDATCCNGPANTVGKCVWFKCQYTCRSGFYEEHGQCKPNCDNAHCHSVKPTLASRGYCDHEGKCTWDCPSNCDKTLTGCKPKCSDSHCHSIKPSLSTRGYCNHEGECTWDCPSDCQKTSTGCKRH